MPTVIVLLLYRLDKFLQAKQLLCQRVELLGLQGLRAVAQRVRRVVVDLNEQAVAAGRPASSCRWRGWGRR